MPSSETSLSRTLRGASVASAVGTVLSTVLGGAALAGDPHYDEAQRYGAVSVHDRDRTAYQPDGVRIGNYVIRPEIGYNITWNDNVFAVPKQFAVGDLRHEIASTVKFTSDLPRHMLDFMLSGSAVRLQEYDYHRFTDFAGHVKFRFDIDHAHNVFGSAMVERAHEDHAEIETPYNAKVPIEVVRTRAEAGVMRDAGKLSASAGVKYESWDYKDVESFGGGLIDQDYRDVRILSPFVKVAYRPSPGYKILGEAYSHFQTTPSLPLPAHTGQGFEARAGAEMELGPLVKIALKAGWRTMSYDDPALAAVSTPVWEARAQWLVSPVLSLSARTERNLVPTSFGEASARLQTRYVAGADYEMWSNLVISAEAEWRKEDFLGSTRLDTGIFARLGAEYQHTKNWVFNATYEHRLRTSTLVADDVTTNKVMLGAKYRY